MMRHYHELPLIYQRLAVPCIAFGGTSTLNHQLSCVLNHPMAKPPMGGMPTESCFGKRSWQINFLSASSESIVPACGPREMIPSFRWALAGGSPVCVPFPTASQTP